jgi:hypothetical protein
MAFELIQAGQGVWPDDIHFSLDGVLAAGDEPGEAAQVVEGEEGRCPRRAKELGAGKDGVVPLPL